MTTNKGGLNRLINKIICIALLLSLTSCSASLSGLSGSEENFEASQTEITVSQGRSFPDGQPTVQTEIITGTQSSCEKPDESYSGNVVLPAAAEYYLSDADDKTVLCFKKIYAGFSSYVKTIDITDGVIHKDDIGSFISLLVCTSPRINQLSPEYVVIIGADDYVQQIKASYSKTKKQGDAELAQLERAAESLCKESDGMNDYDRLKFFHDKIILGCEYSDESQSPYSAYGCLIEGKAVCEGYSKALLMLCEKAGIECIPVMGSSNADGENLPHMWNKVKLDGKWYNVDVTWDDPISNLGSGYLRYDYFNITDSECSADHTFEESVFMKYPTADCKDENYFVKSGLMIQNVSDAKEEISAAAVKAYENGSKYVRLKCSDEKIFEAVTGDNSIISDALKEIARKSNGSDSAYSYSIIKNQRMNTITLILS